MLLYYILYVVVTIYIIFCYIVNINVVVNLLYDIYCVMILSLLQFKEIICIAGFFWMNKYAPHQKVLK